MMKHEKSEGNHPGQKVTGFVNKLKSKIASFEVYVPRGSSGHPEGPAIRSLRWPFLRQAGGKSHREHVRGDFSMTGRKESVFQMQGSQWTKIWSSSFRRRWPFPRPAGGKAHRKRTLGP